MNITKITRIGLISISALIFAGCAHNSARDNATVVGAGLGGLAGAAVSDADPLVTVGGAAIGGLLGNQIYRNDDRRYNDRRYDDRRYDDRRTSYKRKGDRSYRGKGAYKRSYNNARYNRYR
ncbi:MAG: glycine zipper 2TM domain-containing protein [Pelistega sp.]|nr:glycine zipper 2TM domain-containing protein [Pelistega sp.]